MLADALQRLPPPLQVIDPGLPAPSGYGGALGGRFAADFASHPHAANTGPESSVALAEPEGAPHWNVAETSLPPPFEMTSAAPTQVRTSPRSKRPQKSAVGEVVKVVLGGIAGLTITQGVLWWGFHNDPFELGKTLGAKSSTRFLVPKVYWPQADTGVETPTSGSSPKDVSHAATQGGGPNRPAGGGFNSKVDWNSVAGGAPGENAIGKAPAKPGEEPLEAGFDVPGGKPADPLEFDLGDPLKLSPAADPQPAAPEPSVPGTKPDEPTSPAKAPAKPAAGARSIADLTAALDVVRQANQSWRDAATGDKDQRRKAAEALYQSLAQLGEIANRVDDNAEKLPDALGELRRHIAELSADGPTGRIIEVLCAAALDNADRKTPGIAVLGTVQTTARQGSYYVSQIAIATKEPRTVRVLSAIEPSYETGSKILVLGLVVDTSSEPLEGFTGEAGQVVVTRRMGLPWDPSME